MRSIYLFRSFRFSLFIICLSLISCGATVTNVYKKPESSYGTYNVVEIPDFKKTDTEWVPHDSGSEIADMVAESLRVNNRFKAISRSASSGTSNGKKVLLVDGTVTGFRRGCKYCEWVFRGVNDKGKGSMSVWVRLIDKQTGEVLSDAGIEGRAKDPGHGRSRYIRVVAQIVKMIESVNGKP